MVKHIGFLLSCISVVMLGIVGWKSASEQPVLFIFLLLGMATSVGGLCCRWYDYVQDRKAGKT